jgi:hypothetical protein
VSEHPSLKILQAQAREQWATQQDPRFGFSFTYPAQMFAPAKGERRSFYYYGSKETGENFLALSLSVQR